MANSNKVKKYHFIYKTTNLLNDKYYIGMHSTNNIKDGYLGSGTRLRYSIRKYGIKNFKLEIIEWCNSREDLINKESELVNEDLILNEQCLNLKPGGSGGFCNKSHLASFLKGREWGIYLGGITTGKLLRGKELTSEYKNKISNGLIHYFKTNVGNFKNRSHSEETKNKMSELSKGMGSGITNSQYGTCWITNEIINKKITKGDKIPNGFRLGRKIKVKSF